MPDHSSRAPIVQKFDERSERIKKRKKQKMPDLFREYCYIPKKQKMSDLFREYGYIPCNILKISLVFVVFFKTFFGSKRGGHMISH